MKGTSAPEVTPKLLSPRVLALFACSGFFIFMMPGSEKEGRLLSLDVGRDSSFLPALRGGASQPSEFRWSNSAVHGTAGTPFSASLLALTSRGRPARTSVVSALRANVSLSGNARLAVSSPGLTWRNSELQLVLENEVAETVEVKVHLFDENAYAPLDVPTLKVVFSPAPAHTYSLRALPVGTQLQGVSSSEASRENSTIGNRSHLKFPTQIVVDVIVRARDRFGNEVGVGVEDQTGALCASSVSLRSSSSAVDVLHHGEFGFAGRAGRAQIRGIRPGIAELWLEHQGNVDVSNLKEQALRVEFVSYVPPIKSKLLQENATNVSSKDAKWQKVAVEVRDAFLHAWKGYRKHAWGNDELKPISKEGKDTFGNIGMIVLDSLTTLWLMGLHSEFERAADFVEQDLDFDTADREISVFEINIRALGGLLGAHALTGRKIFLTRALELGERLLPALNSTSGLPWPRWNIARQGQVPTTEPTILAEAGTLQLEFRHLTAISGDVRFRDAADHCFNVVQATSSAGLKSVHLTPPWESPARALPDKIQMGALADSYYEYLLKQWVQSPEEGRFKDLWLKLMDELPRLVVPRPDDKEGKVPKYKLTEHGPDGRVYFRMDHLSCFTPGMIALGLQRIPDSDLDSKRRRMWTRMAEGLTESCAELWTSSPTGLAPEFVNLNPRDPSKFAEVPEGFGRHSFLRPETAESLFYLYRLTGDEKYRKLGKKIFKAIVKHAKTEIGYASVEDVGSVPTKKMDEMQSFVMAETFKYLYLLFAPADALDLDRYVLNTEAHPLRILGA